MRAVANSTPLIHLARTRALRLLGAVYEEVVIPRAVYEEVVVRGLERGFSDVEAVKSAVESGLVRVAEAPGGEADVIARSAPLIHRGEAEVFALALLMRPCHVLVDDRAARLVARSLGLEVHGTLYVLVAAARRGAVAPEEALLILDRLVLRGFRVSAGLYARIREELAKTGRG
ncbi:DUF3368 domain-containing protein [Infirmifilum sp. NZ]|uniref:DUF3368 domain-containing protein n=1 Tax=Infirmifilum sp. NZ TaxID=2926850 RepID=UPI00279C95FE|nr:DUF3368 domain-containing protein [Infirmifilum sp. NZ]UNQ73786.1 DUF3368 domain-containing protein [Infirmifilum sp. NZ]